MNPLPVISQRSLTIDEMLKVVGEFGLFQWILEASFCMMLIPRTFQILIMYFCRFESHMENVQLIVLCVYLMVRLLMIFTKM